MKQLNKWWPMLVLAGLEIVLLATNFKTRSWLAGWDNLQPNLNFQAGLERSLFSVWQEYRGLGVIDGMAHAANLIHSLIIWVLSWFLKDNASRFVFHHLMHLIGGLGVYGLIRQLLKQKKDKIIAGLVSAGFYMLNIGTIQMFYTPLEVFSFHYAALPVLSWLTIKYLKTGKKKDLFWFLLASLLFVGQGFVPPLWLVYGLSLGWILILGKKGRGYWKKAGRLLKIVFLINAFWLLPYIYSVVKTAGTITSSKINQLSNENVLLRNQAFGDLKSVSLIKGFSFDYTDIQSGGESDYLMLNWREWFSKREIEIIGYGFFGLAVLGLVIMIKERKREFYALAGMMGIGFLMLGNQIPGLSLVFDTLIKLLFFKEAYRFVFTKFSIIYVLGMSGMIGLGVSWLWEKTNKQKLIGWGLGVLAGLSLIYYAWPAIKGDFYYHNLKVDIPSEYFELIDYFKTEDKNSRVVVLPQPDFWGWTYYDWGFRGSGFLWQGLGQASLDGAFLPWSSENENFYWQINRAIQTSDKELFETVFNKFGIEWLIIDERIKGSGSQEALYLEEIIKMADEAESFKKVKQWGKIGAYRIDLDNELNSFVKVKNDLPEVGPRYEWNDQDTAYLEYGDYIVSDEPDVYYPFRSLFTGREQEELEFEVVDKGESLEFRAQVPEDLRAYELIVPKLEGIEAVKVDKELREEKLDEPKVRAEDKRLVAEIKKDEGFYSYSSLETGELVEAGAKSCNLFNVGEYKKRAEWVGEETWTRFESKGSSNCVGIDFPDLNQNLGYLVRVESQWVSGKSLLFYVINKMSQTRVIETQLPKDKGVWSFIIPPMEEYGLGYTINFDNISIGEQETINKLGKVEIYPIPYNFLKGIKLVKSEVERGSDWQGDFKVKHPNPSYYEVSLNGNGEGVLILSQAFDEGWIGYKDHLFGQKLKNKVLINNWSNGWQIDGDEKKIVLWYWPQVLEYMGFLGWLVAIGWVWRLRYN